MDGWMDGRTGRQHIDGRMDGRMNGRMNGRMDVRTNKWMDCVISC